jgi:hypothetical protein
MSSVAERAPERQVDPFIEARLHAIYQIANAPLRTWPFPHLLIENVLPEDFFAAMIANLPPDNAYTRLVDSGRVSKNYSPQRMSLFPAQLDAAPLDHRTKSFWQDTLRTINSSEFATAIVARFREHILRRLGTRAIEVLVDGQPRSEAFLMRDFTHYALGPHTDTPAKIVSVLFYLAPDHTHPELGTSVYVPKDRSFTCPGGPHHPFALFDRAMTAPYRPNTLFAFPQGPNAFHGVEPVPEARRRDLLLFDLKMPKG